MIANGLTGVAGRAVQKPVEVDANPDQDRKKEKRLMGVLVPDQVNQHRIATQIPVQVSSFLILFSYLGKYLQLPDPTIFEYLVLQIRYQ